MAGQPAAEQALVAAATARASSARAGPQGVRPAQQGGMGQAAAARVPRHRPPGHAVPLQPRPGARQDVLLLVRAGSQRDNHRSRAGQGLALQQVRPLREAPVPGLDKAALRRTHEPRGPEMGQAQEDPQPCIPSREAQGISSSFSFTITCSDFSKIGFVIDHQWA